MAEETRNCARVFISYAHEDQEWLARVEDHLGGLKHEGLIAPFDDRAISIGAEWDETIKRKLDESDLVIFLVSASFLNSWYIHKVEVERALQRHNEGKANVMGIVLKHCHWERMPFAKVQVFPRPGPKGIVPVSRWDDPDEALTEIARDLWDWAEEFRKKAAATREAEAQRKAATAEAGDINLARYAERARLKYEASTSPPWRRPAPTTPTRARSCTRSSSPRPPAKAARR